MTSRKGKTIAVALVIGALAVVWFILSRPPTIVAESESLAEAMLQGDADRLYASTSERERKLSTLTPENVKLALNRLIVPYAKNFDIVAKDSEVARNGDQGFAGLVLRHKKTAREVTIRFDLRRTENGRAVSLVQAITNSSAKLRFSGYEGKNAYLNSYWIENYRLFATELDFLESIGIKNLVALNPDKESSPIRLLPEKCIAMYESTTGKRFPNPEQLKVLPDEVIKKP